MLLGGCVSTFFFLVLLFNMLKELMKLALHLLRYVFLKTYRKDYSLRFCTKILDVSVFSNEKSKIGVSGQVSHNTLILWNIMNPYRIHSHRPLKATGKDKI